MVRLRAEIAERGDLVREKQVTILPNFQGRYAMVTELWDKISISKKLV